MGGRERHGLGQSGSVRGRARDTSWAEVRVTRSRQADGVEEVVVWLLCTERKGLTANNEAM